MKKIVFGIVFMFLATGLWSQYTAKGNFVIGSTLGFSSANSKITQDDGDGDVESIRPTSTQFNISPSLGYFLMDEFVLGIGLDYTNNSVDQGEGENNLDSDLLFGPYARYYMPVTEDMAFFLEANFGFGTSTDNLEIAGQTQNISTNIFAFGLGPGYTIFSSNAIGIEALIQYNYARSNFDTDIGGEKRNTTTRTNQFDFSIGFQFYFGGVEKATTNTNSHRLY
jgi:hypothetical protein